MRSLRAILTITLKRLWAQRGLTLAILLGLATAVALITCVPIYADAVHFRVLQERLDASAATTQTPPFAYLYRYIGTWYGPVQWEDTRALDDYLTNRGAAELGLPLDLLVRHFETNQYRLFPGGNSDYSDASDALTTVSFATTSGIADHIDITEGQFPPTAPAAPDSIVPVLVAESLATQLGLQVGDTLAAYNFRDQRATHRTIPVQIAGVWRARDETAPFWFYKPTVFESRLLVSEATFAERLSPYLNDEIQLALWYLVLDGRRVDVSDVNWVTSRATRVAREVDARLPNTRNDTTPVDGLTQYRRAVQTLTRLLAAFSVPLVGLILAFIGLAVGLAVNQRRNEIAVMRSRGGTVWQILGFAALEGLLLGAAALGLGLLGGLALAQLMGQARTFMDFSAAYSAAHSAVSHLRVALPEAAIRAGLLAGGLAVVAMVLPALSAARDTVITYKQEQARAGKRPWWQRAWLDILLLVPVIYGLYVLRRQGTLFIVTEGGSDPLQNPLLLLLPTLATFSLTLFCLRLLPWLMEALSWVLTHSNSVGLLLATRHLARTPGQYATPLILLALTTSLSVFTASLARTIDLQLFDEIVYQTGTDVNLIGAGIPFGGGSSFGPPTDPAAQRALFLPMSEYLTLPGIQAATRIGRYSAVAQVGQTQSRGIFLGVDRATFAQAAYWRYDFAPVDLGYLLNALATTPDGVLVPQSFLRENRLRVGDFFRLSVHYGDTAVPLLVQIVGVFDYFPTYMPLTDGVLLVGNLETLFAQAGGEFAYEVWLRTTPTFDGPTFDQALHTQGLFGWQWREPYTRIEREQLKPERQGVFGLLSVGFAAAALLTVLGFFLYALFSFRRRFIELGILRAVGLSRWQMMGLVSGELAFLILAGLTLGTGLGVWISRQFIPYLQTEAAAGGAGAAVLPYLVEIAWSAVVQIYLLFGFMFLIALLALAVLLIRMKIFQAVKLGETA